MTTTVARLTCDEAAARRLAAADDGDGMMTVSVAFADGGEFSAARHALLENFLF